MRSKWHCELKVLRKTCDGGFLCALVCSARIKPEALHMLGKASTLPPSYSPSRARGSLTSSKTNDLAALFAVANTHKKTKG